MAATCLSMPLSGIGASNQVDNSIYLVDFVKCVDCVDNLDMTVFQPRLLNWRQPSVGEAGDSLPPGADHRVLFLIDVQAVFLRPSDGSALLNPVRGTARRIRDRRAR